VLGKERKEEIKKKKKRKNVHDLKIT